MFGAGARKLRSTRSPGLGGNSGALGLAADRVEQRQLAHQGFDLAARDLWALAAQLPQTLSDPVDTEVGVEHPLDLGLQSVVAADLAEAGLILAA